MVTNARKKFAKALKSGDLSSARDLVTLVAFPNLDVASYRRLYDRAISLIRQESAGLQENEDFYRAVLNAREAVAREVAPFAGVVHTPRVF